MLCFYLSPAGCFFADATAGDSAGDPVSLSESLLAFVGFLFVECLFFCTIIHFQHLPALPYCIHVHMLAVSVGCLFVGLGLFYER